MTDQPRQPVVAHGRRLHALALALVVLGAWACPAGSAESGAALAAAPSPRPHQNGPGTAAALPSWGSGGPPQPPWRVMGIPGGRTPPTRFDVVVQEGTPLLRVQTAESYGNLVLATPPESQPGRLRWHWRIDQAVAGADLLRRERDDTPLKVCAMFDVPADAMDAWDRMQLALARSLSGENLPAATLCYVWDASLPVGTVLRNAYTARLRMVVVAQGPGGLGVWQSFERNLAADFRLAYGTESERTPTLVGFAIGGDSDNTHGASLAWLAPMSWTHP